MKDLSILDAAESRSISAENSTGAKGQGGMAVRGTGEEPARELGQGWKVSPSVQIGPGESFELADIAGPGTVEHIWVTPTGNWRCSILRIYWDDQEHPSVECPVGDFFGCGWGLPCQITSLAVCVNPGSAFNCYWAMPFRRRCRVTLENVADEGMVLYYQIDYALVPDTPVAPLPRATGPRHAGSSLIHDAGGGPCHGGP